jgi:hypothetical protein
MEMVLKYSRWMDILYVFESKEEYIIGISIKYHMAKQIKGEINIIHEYNGFTVALFFLYF